MSIKYFFVLNVFLLICCTGKNNLNQNKEVINVTTEELINKLNMNEQQTIDDYKQYRVQITDIIKSIGRPKDNVPKFDASYIVFGDYDEMVRKVVVARFDQIVVDDLDIGDTITIQGNLVSVEKYQDGSMHVELKRCDIIKFMELNPSTEEMGQTQ
jgi:hypothetical protein